MDLRGRLSGWLDSFRRPQDDSASVDASQPVEADALGTSLQAADLRYRYPTRQATPSRCPHRANQAKRCRFPAMKPGPIDRFLPRLRMTCRRLVQPAYPAAAGADRSAGTSPANTAASFWDVLDPTEREALRSVASWRTFAAGARLMEEGERADHVMVILGGRVKVCVDENGSERVLAVRGLGQLVGERGALKVSVRSATVVALDMIWALVVQTKDFAAFISAHPRVLAIVQSQLDRRRRPKSRLIPGPGRTLLASLTKPM